MLVQRQVRHKLLKLAVFFLKLTEASKLRQPHTVKLALPAVKGLLTYIHLPANLRNLGAAFGLAQSKGNLLLREPLLHLNLLKECGTRKVRRKYNPQCV